MKGSLFGQEIYATIFDKAAAYLFFIIKDHVFNGGNKRTGMESAFIFLEKNGLSIREDLDPAEIVEVAEKVAACQLELKGIADWLRKNSFSR